MTELFFPADGELILKKKGKKNQSLVMTVLFD
jgi:hypothetical protein